MEGVIWE